MTGGRLSAYLTTNAQKLLREMLRAAREADDVVLTNADQREALALLSRLALEPSLRPDE
jgi:molybdenum-dependent DNA-binding transcriptional regulator ModE